MSHWNRIFRRSLAPVLVIVLCAVCATPLAAQDAPEEPAEEQTITLRAVPATPGSIPPPLAFDEGAGSDYRIGRQDLLEISVFDVDELNQVVRVSENGSVSMPLLGKLSVAGLTKGELEDMIARLLGERFVHDPQVTVFVKEYESKKVAVSGSVKQPGAYEMLGRKTLLEMLSMAGGLDREPGREIIIFRRTEEGLTRRLSVDLERLVYGADPSLNAEVFPGDIIYVPAVEMVRIFVTGAVRDPGQYEVPRSAPVTALKAITLAGGTTDRAAEKQIQIMRYDPAGNRVIYHVNLRKIKRGKADDPVLQEEDVVLVPEAFF